MPPITVHLESHFNQAYSGDLMIGESFFKVSFNTGMHGIWIPGRIRTAINPRTGTYRYLTNQENFYDADESNTYDEAPGTETSISWRNGAVTISGTRRTDEMIIGSVENHVTLSREFVIYDTVVPLRFYRRLPYDGFVGLGLPPPANNDAVADVPIWMTMMDQALLPSYHFSLYLRNSGDDNGGSIIFGGVDGDDYIGLHQFYDLVDNSYEWKIHMYSVAVAGNLPQYCYKVLIDSGSKYIYGPPHIIHAINRQICGREVPLLGTTFLTEREAERISQGPDVTFNFYEDDYLPLTIGPEDYVIDDVDEQAYTTAFRPLEFQPGDETYFVLGLPWLLRYHTIFDFGQRRIGFARSVQ